MEIFYFFNMEKLMSYLDLFTNVTFPLKEHKF